MTISHLFLWLDTDVESAYHYNKIKNGRTGEDGMGLLETNGLSLEVLSEPAEEISEK